MNTISIYCPPMLITRDGDGLKKTAAEPMVATITLQDTTLTIPIMIPPTLVKRKSMFQWMVDACTAFGADVEENVLTVDLPEEPTVFDVQTMTLTAKSITANGTLVLSNGQIGQVIIVFPDCKVDLFPLQAEAITALGSITF